MKYRIKIEHVVDKVYYHPQYKPRFWFWQDIQDSDDHHRYILLEYAEKSIENHKKEITGRYKNRALKKQFINEENWEPELKRVIEASKEELPLLISELKDEDAKQVLSKRLKEEDSNPQTEVVQCPGS